MVQRKLPPEVKEKLLEALRTGVAKGYGYHRIWRMLKESGVEISRSTVRDYYYKNFPGKLKKRGPYLQRELRVKLYDEVRRLRKKGLSYSMIIDEVYKSHDVRLKKSVISRWCRNICSPYNGIRIPSIDFLEPSPELSQVIGTVAGDGWAVEKKNGIYEVGAGVKDEELVEEFSRCLGKVLGRDPPRPRLEKDGRLAVEVKSKALYELLRKPIDIDKIAPYVEHCEECMRRFARSFFDSEGGVSKDGRIYCYNSDLQLLQYVRKILNILGIRTTEPKICVKKGTIIFDRRNGKTFTTKKDVYRICVRMSDVLRFYQHIGFTIQRKQKRLEEYLRKRGLL
ncbi:MAG: LAGLIDADG family homing endonuclease [Candidatus Nezhaarchaeales archaeon]